MLTKDFESLLRLLDVSEQSGTLYIEPENAENASWRAACVLRKGQIMACTVQHTSDGRELLRGRDALNWLMSVGTLSWYLDESVSAPSNVPYVLPSHQENTVLPPRQLPAPAPTSRYGERPVSNSLSLPSPTNRKESLLSYVPRRTAEGVNVAVSSRWQREHRLVFALVDGHRTLEEIAHLLHKTPEIVVQVLRDLQNLGWIK